jgi:predicted RecB family nuclease
VYKRLERLAIKESLSQSKRLKLPNGETITLVLDTNSAWRCFAESVSNTKAPIFHWTSYDATHLKKEAPPEVREALLPRLHDLCKSFDSAVKMPIKGKSLKTVGAYLGFAWRGYDDWGAAYVDYQKWLNSHDLNALASACVYQQDDVTAMMVVRRWLVENAPHELK